MSRFTITDLRSSIGLINAGLESNGALVRFVEQGRNGYQAVDEYPVNAKGERVGSHVTRMIGYGTSRGASDSAWVAYYQIVDQLKNEKIERLQTMLRALLRA